VGGILHLLPLSRRLIHEYKLPYTSPIALRVCAFVMWVLSYAVSAVEAGRTKG